MKSRHLARQIALQILFQMEFGEENGGTRSELIESHLQHFKPELDAESSDFVRTLVKGTIENRGTLDQVISNSAENWSVVRMGNVDRNLLRLGAYEILYDQDTPKSVTINESIELAKTFGTEETPAFVNGILDKMTGEALPKA